MQEQPEVKKEPQASLQSGIDVMTNEQDFIPDKDQFLTPKDQLGYAEEYIVLKNDYIDGELLNYTLSNKLEDIEIAVYNKTRQIIKLKNAHWKINPHLSVIVKQLMKKHNVKYSMTIREEKTKNKIKKTIYINMRTVDFWFATGYDEFEGKFYCWDKMESIQAIKNFIKELYSNDDD